MTDERSQPPDISTLLNALFSQTSVGICLIDEHGYFVRVGQHHAALLGYEPEELVGQPFTTVIPEDFRERALEHFRDNLNSLEAYPAEEWPHLRKDGTRITVFCSAGLIVGEDGKRYGVAVINDVTAQKQQAEQLKLITRAVEYSHEAVLITDNQPNPPGPRIVYANPAFCEMSGYTAEELEGQSPRILQGPFSDRAVLDRVREALTKGTSFKGQIINHRKDGSTLLVEWVLSPVRDDHGQITHWVANQRDVTEEVEQTRRLAESEERLALTIAATGEGIWDWDIAGGYLYWSRRFMDMVGIPPDQFVPHIDTFRERLHPEDRERILQAVEAHLHRGEPYDVVYRLRRVDGTYIHVSAKGQATWDKRGEPVRMVGAVMDISELVRAKANLDRAERVACMGHFYADIDRRTMTYSPGLYALLGLDPQSRRAREAPWNDLSHYHRDDRDWVRGRLLAALKSRKPVTYEARVVRTTGETRFVHVEAQVEVGADDRVHAFFGTVQDITDLEMARQNLLRAEDVAQIGHWRVELDKRFIQVSPVINEIFGLPPEHRMTLEEAIGRYHPEDQPVVREAVAAAIDNGEPFNFEVRVLRPNGEVRHVCAESEVEFAVDGAVLGFFGILQDVTERVQREAQLRHAQQMEIVGQLAGGLSHDFNNLLGIIMGNLEFLEAEDLTEKATERLVNAMNAADRAGQLTNRLLSFARRQMLRPQEVRVGDVMDNIERLIGPLLPESIQFSVRGRAMQTAIQVDQGLLEASLLNLIVNARDAVMSEGDGRRRRIVFFAETDPADDTVTFGVRDDGPGIPESVRERMFEPFFTTKEGGAGSGLGLSMALGFAQQSGGSIDVVSEPGSGADVRLKLPTVHKHAPGPANNNDTDRAHDHLTAQGQVVLLVEDEPDLRSVATDRLEQYGFQVISVPTADAGLKALEDRARIDLVVSDLVTPGAADGMEVLERARETHPKAGRIAITGYSERLSGAATKHKDLSVLIKPFTQRDLARAIDTARNAADERFAAE